jgi:uncharacterized membrane protein (UPF0136 family)
VLLVVGGLIGFLKAKSRVSLILAVVFAGLLSLCASDQVLQPQAASVVCTVLLVALLGVFGARLVQTKKFMPSGLMFVVTLVTLVQRLLL